MAAAVSGVFPVCLDPQQTCVEGDEAVKKNVQLMQKLRNKRSSPHRSWTDVLMKSIRTTVVDRKLQADSSERNQVQKCLDTLQRAMKVMSQQSLIERLELVARQQELTFHVSASDQPSVTLKADMFHIEITLNKGGGVKEVKIAHQGDINSICHELTDILSRGDFVEFTSHLEGLQSIYGVTGEKKLKSKAFFALQSLEKDLNYVAEFQNSISGVANYIHKSPLGILLPRTAGKPMKLIYFVSPYDLLDKKTHSARPMTVETITEHGLGRSVTVCLEPGPSTKLQTMPLMSVNKISDGNCLPLFNGLTHANSVSLPAHFVLVLQQPIPVAASVLQKIQSITQLDIGKEAGSQPLLSLILDCNSDGKMKKDQQLFVSLPDQHHQYFISGVSGGLLDEPGVMLSRIPFNHPTHVAKILIVLRQQLLFNSLLASCVRPSAKKDPATSLVFEMTVISLSQIMVVFEHPAYDTMITVDLDLSDITSLRCRMQCNTEEHSLCSDDYASQVLQRCLSLPVLLRALVRKGRDQLERLMAEAKARAEEEARRAQEAALWAAAQARQQQTRFAPTLPAKARPPPPQPPPPQLTPTYPPTPSPITSNPPSVGGMGDLRGMVGAVDLLVSSPPGYPVMPGVAGEGLDKNNPLLVNLLDSEQGMHNPLAGGGAAAPPETESPMLSRLLDDNISVATNINPIPMPHAALPPTQPKPKGTKGRKRRSQSDMQVGRSPKHRVSDSDTSERPFDLDSSSSPFESSLGGSGGLAGFHHQMGPIPPRPSSQGHMSSVIDLTDENESSLKKLVDFSMGGGATPDSELQSLLARQDHSASPSTGIKANQMTGSKNENASTSPEGLLIGSGQVGKASLPDPAAAHSKFVAAPTIPNSHASPPTSVAAAAATANSAAGTTTTLAAFLGHGPAGAKARRDSNSSLQPLSSQFPPHLHHTHHPPPDLAAAAAAHHMTSVGAGGGMVAAPPGVVPGVGDSGGVTAMAVSRPKVVSSSCMTEVPDVKPPLPSGRKGSSSSVGEGVKTSSNTESVMDKRGLFEKFDFAGQAVSSGHITITSSSVTPASSTPDGDDLTAPKVRLKLHGSFRTPQAKSQSMDSGLLQSQSPSSAGSKSSNSNTFDFRSDEDDDEPGPINYVPTDRLSVYSSSPTRLQISSKGKPPTPVPIPDTVSSGKPEKYKRKDKSSGNAKRKKNREESKKERKKKKFDHDDYVPTGKEPVYRASTVESDQKTGTKLKIRVSKEPIKMPSPVKEGASAGRMDMTSEKVGKFSEKVNDAFRRRATPAPMVEKLVLQKQDIKEHHVAAATGDEGGRERDMAHLYRHSSSSKAALKSASSSKGGLSSSSNTFGKDPKLAKAIIRLKSINITTASSTSVTLTPPAKSSSSRGSSERRSQSSLSTSTSTPSPVTTGALSLSAILPNAPTASSVASLPPIPKIPKVSSAQTSNTTTTTANSKAGMGATPNSLKNSSAINSGFNNAVNKMSGGSPGMGGGRQGANQPGALKSSGMGFNKTGGGQKSQINMGGGGLRTSANSGMPPGILKNSGNVGQIGSNSQKALAPGGQGLQKGPGGLNQLPNTYGRGPNSAMPSQGILKNASSSQGLNKGSVPSGLSRGTNNGNQAMHKGSGSGQGAQRSPNLSNQGAGGKGTGSPNQNVGPQKAPPQGKTFSGSSSSAGVHRSLSQGGGQSQKQQLSQGNNFAPKTAGSATSNSTAGGQGQKVGGSQSRSLSTGSYSSSPNSGRTAGGARTSSTSGGSGGTGRTPPNHLPLNRSMSASSQKSSASSPRTHSPSNPAAPRFPGNSPQQKGSGASPSSVSQRSASSSQANSHRSSNSSSGPRSSSTSSQRSTSSPQGQRSSSSGRAASPNQRPASNPGPESRLSTSGVGQSPGYPVRPSSAGPRQSSSPQGSKASGSSPSGSRTSSPGGQSQRSSAGNGISPLVSRHSSSGGLADTVSLSRDGFSSSGVSSASVSKPNSGNAGSSSLPAVSRQTSNSGTPVSVSRQNSSGSLNPSMTSQQNSSMKQNTSSSSLTPASRPNSNSSANSSASSVCTSSSSSSGAKLSSGSEGSSAAVVCSSSSSSQSGSVGAATAVQSRPSSSQCSTTTTSTSGKPSTTSTSSPPTSVTMTSASSVPPASSSLRTSSTSSAASSKVGSGTAAGSKPVTLKSASGTKTSTLAGGVGKGGGAGKTSAAGSALTTSVGAKTAVASSSRSASVSTVSPASVASNLKPVSSVGGSASVAGSVSVSAASGFKAQSVSLPASQAKSSTSSTSSVSLSHPSSSSSSASSVNVSSSGVSGKGLTSGAARGRKGSLSAIVDKLATKMNASSGSSLDIGESLGSSGAVGGSAGADVATERRASVPDEGSGREARAGVKRSASLSGLSPPGSEHKVPCMEALGKSVCPSTSAPSPAHSAPAGIVSASPLAAGEGRRSGSVGEKSSPSQLRDFGETGLDLSIPKDKARSDSTSTVLPPPRPDSRGHVSPRDSGSARSGSPAVGSGLDKIPSGTKFNGESSKDKSRAAAENELFKVPTPKNQSFDDSEDRGGSSSRLATASPVCNSNSRPLPAPASPMSDASSPGNDLVIDCDDGPALPLSQPPSSASSRVSGGSSAPSSVHPSPKRVAELCGEAGSTSGLVSGKSSPSNSSRSVKSSPQPSPLPKISPSRMSSSPALNDASANSPCEIDDDLMDAALMGFGAS